METTFVTHLVLYERRGENVGTAPSPMRAWQPGLDEALLKVERNYCLSWDDDQPIKANTYSVLSVKLPSWLPVDEWVRHHIDWRYLWGHGVDPRWPEAWQRSLKDLRLGAWQRAAVVALLKTKNFRSERRASFQRQIIEWLETEPLERKYKSPLSSRQWESLYNPHQALDAKRRDDSLYSGSDYYPDRGLGPGDEPTEQLQAAAD